MQPNNMYRNLSIVLAIIAIVFAVLYFTKPSQPVSETFSDISADAQVCKEKVAMWQSVHGAEVTTSAETKADLQSILKGCKDGFQDSQEKL